MLDWKKVKTQKFCEPRLGADVQECELDIRRDLFRSSIYQVAVQETR